MASYAATRSSPLRAHSVWHRGQLEAHHCVRTQCGTVDEIRQICSALMVMDRLTPSPLHISSHVALTLAYAPS